MSNSRERRIGPFRVEGGEGQSGSQGSVYRAVCEEAFPGVAVGETVAIKTMPSEDDPDAYARFERRVARLLSIRNDHVVRYRGCFSTRGPFQTLNVVVMDWLDGWTLKERLEHESGGLDADEALQIADGLLSGLDAAHAAGLVHRDIKPGNVFLGRDGSVKLIDFGVARRTSSTTLSSAGGFAGTFDYMAPEFADPKFGGTVASDVFSVGVVLHEMLTGQVPYARKTEKGEQADFAFLSRWSQRKEGLCAIRLKSSVRRVLAHADEVLLKALAENPTERYPDVPAFREALRQIRFREVRSTTDSYRLLRLVGEGGFGCVYKALARSTGRFVAVKQLKRLEFGDRFRHEARVMQRLDDPAFVRLIDYFETRDVGAAGAFIVMDFLPGMPGSSLRDAIRRAEGMPLPFADVIAAFERYARALALMHRQRIFHRDIKPSNLYYPVSDLARAALMDLGIARDVSGTATVGQVPGTLDYMPPEVVIGDSRGDAGMDIYALGLCLYESVSGKPGYPRLPTGAQAFPAFYERARSRKPPVFDSPVVRSRPMLLALLRDMTALDLNMRLQDAELLRRRLMAVAAEVPGDSASAQTVTDLPKRPPNDAPTGVTAGGEMPAPKKKPASPSRRRWALVAAAALVAAVAGWGPLVRGIAALRESSHQKNVQAILAEDQAAREAEASRQRQEAEDAARRVLALFATNGVTATVADAEASRWMLDWRDNAAVAGIFAAQTNAFAQAREERRARDVAKAAQDRLRMAEAAADALAEACRDANAAAEDCEARIRDWRTGTRGEIAPADFARLDKRLADELAERKNRDAIAARERREREETARLRNEAAEKAVAGAGPVMAAYDDEQQTIDAADAAQAAWRSAWRDVLDMPTVADAAKRIAEARRRRAGTEDGAKVVAECSRYLDNILLVGAEDVKNWRGLVRQAEITLQKAEATDRIAPSQAKAVRRRIEQCKDWRVGVIDNKTDRVVMFGGRTIGPVTAATVVLTNGFPVGAALMSEGCEPIHVREERFSARVFTVMPQDLDERACEMKAVVPAFPEELLCIVDGVERKPGEIMLRRGRHVVKYYRREETYPGIRDYDPKEYVFETRLAYSVEVPPPSGDWVLSASFKTARENAGLMRRGQAIEAECRKQLDPQPLETRRARLEKAHALLNDWQTSSALAILGVGVENKLRTAYAAERNRIRGWVKNDTALPASVTTDGEPVAVPPGEKRMVTFERRWREDARVEIPGYEFVMLPQESAKFDGQTFAVGEERLVALPVRVTVPDLPKDVTFQLDGKAVTGGTDLRPGDYEGAYVKNDCIPQKIPFKVEVAKPITLPKPSAWQRSGAFDSFTEALSAFNAGAVDAAKKLTDSIGTVEDPKRRQELEDLRRAIELRKQLEAGTK